MDESKSEFLAAIQGMFEKVEARRGVFNTPTVRLSSDALRFMIDKVVTDLEKRASCLQETIDAQEKVLSEARARNLNVTGRDHIGPLGGPPPEAELSGLRARIDMLNFTSRHLVPGATFELDAHGAYVFLHGLPGVGGGGFIPRY